MIRKTKDNFNNYFRAITIPLSFISFYLLLFLVNPYSSWWKNYFNNGFSLPIMEWMLVLLFCFIVTESSLITAHWLDRKIPWLNHAIKRFFVQIFIQIIVVVLLLQLLIYLFDRIYPTNDLHAKSQLQKIEDWQFIFVSLFLSVLVSIFHIVNYLITKWKNSVLEAAEFEINAISQKEIAMQSELESLRLQLDPHFMFNNFSTLSELIAKNQSKANLFLDNLSRVYRYMIMNLKKNVVPIEEEIKFVQAYIYLLQIRYGNNINITINIPKKNFNKGIFPITLQLLIENAIKHNIATNSNPLHIRIYMSDDDHIIVANNLQKMKVSAHTSKIGLENIKSRYRILSEKAPQIIVTGTQFIVQLPVLNM